jgi:hypothetical protein
MNAFRWFTDSPSAGFVKRSLIPSSQERCVSLARLQAVRETIALFSKSSEARVRRASSTGIAHGGKRLFADLFPIKHNSIRRFVRGQKPAYRLTDDFGYSARKERF